MEGSEESIEGVEGFLFCMEENRLQEKEMVTRFLVATARALYLLRTPSSRCLNVERECQQAAAEQISFALSCFFLRLRRVSVVLISLERDFVTLVLVTVAYTQRGHGPLREINRGC